MNNILFVNHQKSHCGVYEIGKRIFNLIDQKIIPLIYLETDNSQKILNAIEEYSPIAIIYNYFFATMPFVNESFTKKILSGKNIKHIAIHHDPMGQKDIINLEKVFDYWIIHDDTNTIPSPTKFLTVRPILRYERKGEPNLEKISIGTHGLIASHWKMYDTIVEYINNAFDEVTINMNLGVATFGKNLNEVVKVANMCRAKVRKPGIKLNIIHDYFPTEIELVDWLAKNTMNIYFYNANPGAGVGGSADLAISAQSSLAINDTYMFRHISNHLGICSQNTLKNFLGNYNEVRRLYQEWSPERITNDYKKMLESVL
ncbi:MAG: hypothetical protein PHF86_10380 [Candidatus Nanoarchaeia archaeon]|nr:hypothetical protein [Candidatus Nanoarchaeia archaeon]